MGLNRNSSWSRISGALVVHRAEMLVLVACDSRDRVKSFHQLPRQHDASVLRSSIERWCSMIAGLFLMAVFALVVMPVSWLISDTL